MQVSDKPVESPSRLPEGAWVDIDDNGIRVLYLPRPAPSEFKKGDKVWAEGLGRCVFEGYDAYAPYLWVAYLRKGQQRATINPAKVHRDVED